MGMRGKGGLVANGYLRLAYDDRDGDPLRSPSRRAGTGHSYVTPTSLLRHSSMHASLSLSSRMASLELLGRDDKRSG